MRAHFPAAFAENETVRYLYRANHIYILLTALVNLALSAHLQPAAGIRGRIQVAGSVLLTASLVLLVAAFFREPPHPDPHRPFTGFGIYAAVAGVIAHVLAAPRRAA
jgi:hypothetical protein